MLGAAAQSDQAATLETSLLPTPSHSLSPLLGGIESPNSLTEAASPTGSLLVPSFQALNECPELGNIKSSLQGTGKTPMVFRIRCKTDRPSPYSLLQVRVYTFGDCIDACASYNYNKPLHKNSTCAGVTYGTAGIRKTGGNCFFMNDLNADTKADDEVSTAIYLRNG